MEPVAVTLSGPPFDDTTRALMAASGVELRSVDVLADGWQSLDGARAHILGGPEVLDRKALHQLPDTVELVCFLGTGYSEYMDPDALAAHGVATCYTPHANAAAVAEFTLTLLLACIRHLDDGLAQVDQGRWEPPMGRSLASLEVGVVGFGHVGQELVRLLYQGFGITPRVWNRTPRHDQVVVAGGVLVELAQLVADSDAVLLCASPGPEPLLTPDILANAKVDQVVVNTARAELVEPQTLREHLLARPDVHWCSDVYYTEPVAPDTDPYGLLALGPSHFLLTPHMAYASTAATAAMGQMVLANLLALNNGEPLPNALCDPR